MKTQILLLVFAVCAVSGAPGALLVSNATVNGTIYIHAPGGGGMRLEIIDPYGRLTVLYADSDTVQVHASYAGIWTVRAGNETLYSFVSAGNPNADYGSAGASQEPSWFAWPLPYFGVVFFTLLAAAMALLAHALADRPSFVKTVSGSETLITLRNGSEALSEACITDGGLAFRRNGVAPRETITFRHHGRENGPARLACKKAGKPVELESEVEIIGPMTDKRKLESKELPKRLG